MIDDRDGNPISFKYNAAQELLQDRVDAQTKRLLVLKARQLGCTTFWLARAFKKWMTQNNHTSVIVAYEELLTQRLLNRVQLMYDRLPIPENKKPKMTHKSANEKFLPSRNTVIYIGTAGSKTFGRGEPIHFFLGSEVAHWEEPNRILTPVFEAVPKSGEIILESTPNGEGTDKQPNVFYQMVKDCLDGDSSWELLSLFWWLEPEYKLPVGDSLAIAADRDRIANFAADEQGLIDRLNWSPAEADERIRWRRWKQNEMRRTGNLFLQEFMEDVASCFLTVKEPFYDYMVLEQLGEHCKPPVEHFRVAETPATYAEIWCPPDREASYPVYLIAVDPGQGKNTRSVATVWRCDLDDFNSVRHEATLAGYWIPEVFAPMVVRLAEYYHNAKIVPEANGHGMSFCAQVATYHNLYRRTDVVLGVEQKRVGWLTTGAAKVGSGGTKMYMMTELQSLISTNRLLTQDANLVRELRQVRYVYPHIQFIGSDDYHDSAAIMAATRHTVANVGVRGFIGSTGWKW